MKDKIKARSVPFSQTRSRHAGETAEDYVEAVMELIEEQGECRVLDLAGYFNVSHVTVSRIVKRLQNENLMHSKPYRPVELTDKGSKLAKRVKERHEIVLAFLISFFPPSTKLSVKVGEGSLSNLALVYCANLLVYFLYDLLSKSS